MPTFNMMKKMETRRLHNTEMKKIMRVFHGNSSNVKQDIKNLPRRMRYSPLSTSSNLCNIHKGLDHHLINEIQSWIRHEFEGGIGRYIYPVIMGGKLTATQELKIRQLEPVLQIWRQDFKAVTSAPPGREPIHSGDKWKYQRDQCPACTLARIGSDEDVLFALYAGMISRFHTSKLVTGKVPLAELDVAKLDNPKSKRVRLVRYWIKASSRSDTLLLEAAKLGIKMKQLHREWKDARRITRPSIYDGQFGLDGFTTCNAVIGDPFCDSSRTEHPRITISTTTLGSTTADPFRDSTGETRRAHARSPSTGSYMGIDVDEPYAYNDLSSRLNSRLGRQPRPANIYSRSPLDQLGFNTIGSSSGSSLQIGSDIDTIFPDDSISVVVAPLRINKDIRSDPQSPIILNYPARHNRHDSLHDAPSTPRRIPSASSRCTSSISSGHPSGRSSSHHSLTHTSLASTSTTILSYDGGNVHDTHVILQERVSKYKSRCDESGLPVPQRQSMYHGYGEDKQEDPFEDVDTEVLEEEEVSGDGRIMNGSESTATRWEDLY
jgi:hypothetical protein